MLLPTDNQAHVTFELTRGLAPNMAIGAMLTATGPGVARGPLCRMEDLSARGGAEIVGLPVDLGLVVEISFQDQRYEENTRQVELRPIIEKNIGRYQFDFNPVFRAWSQRAGKCEWLGVRTESAAGI